MVQRGTIRCVHCEKNKNYTLKYRLCTERYSDNLAGVALEYLKLYQSKSNW